MKTFLEVRNMVDFTINEFIRYHKINPNRIILSRNYVDIIKHEYESYDIEITDCELKIMCLPIIIDECSTNKIEVAFGLVRYF